MATYRREQAAHVVRYHPPGVTPLEIWDLSIGEGILSDHIGSQTFGEVLYGALGRLHSGCGRTRSAGELQGVCRGFDTVVLTGGGASRSLLVKSSGTAPFATASLGSDPFIGEPGGYWILGNKVAEDAVVDVGQVQIKVTMAGRRFSFPRDFEALPVRAADGCGREDRTTLGVQRDRLERFVGDSLHRACRWTSCLPKAAVIALPCELDDEGLPGRSSYLGTEGNVDLVANALDHANLGGCAVTVLNDAELAALSVAVSPAAMGGQRILVVTIGFGVGAALLETKLWKK